MGLLQHVVEEHLKILYSVSVITYQPGLHPRGFLGLRLYFIEYPSSGHNTGTVISDKVATIKQVCLLILIQTYWDVSSFLQVLKQ